MRKVLYALVIISSVNMVVAQTDSVSSKKKRKYEWGMNLYSSTIRGGDFYSNYKLVSDHYCFSGLYFKTHRGKNAFRYSAGYFQKIIDNSYFFSRLPGRFISSRSIQLTAGYQRSLNGNKVVPYFFSDVSLDHTKEMIRDVYIYYPYGSKIDYYPGGYGLRRIGFQLGIVPGFGMRVKLKKNAFLNFETAAQFFFYKGFGGSPGPYKMIGVNAKPFVCQLGILF